MHRSQKALSAGFDAIAEQFKLPASFPPEVLLAADEAANAKRSDGQPFWMAERRDATDLAFVTLDPASSTDLDQAFTLDRDGDDLVLYYPLADVGAFVPIGEISSEERGNVVSRSMDLLRKSRSIPK